ncbi:hypothetical protein LCGC14_0417750 [marine sediment metagenome]|uniref:Uncharacterized protein n=1 Tax=marine sediment metagenome TaxID=412755 RepID=A0A0F9SXN7_9ZZZZ
MFYILEQKSGYCVDFEMSEEDFEAWQKEPVRSGYGEGDIDYENM